MSVRGHFSLQSSSVDGCLGLYLELHFLHLLHLLLLISALLGLGEEEYWDRSQSFNFFFLGDLVRAKDEFWNLNLNKRSINIQRLLLVLLIVQPGLWTVLIVDYLLDFAAFQLFKIFRSANTAPKRKNAAQVRIRIGWRVSNAKRAFDTTAVLHSFEISAVATFAEVVGTPALIDRH